MPRKRDSSGILADEFGSRSPGGAAPTRNEPRAGYGERFRRSESRAAYLFSLIGSEGQKAALIARTLHVAARAERPCPLDRRPEKASPGRSSPESACFELEIQSATIGGFGQVPDRFFFGRLSRTR